MNLAIIIVGLIIGYFMYILGILKSKKNDLNDVLTYIKDKDIETLFDVLSLIVIAGLWWNTDVLNIFAKSVWVSPIVGILTPVIWAQIIKTYEKVIVKIQK